MRFLIEESRCNPVHDLPAILRRHVHYRCRVASRVTQSLILLASFLPLLPQSRFTREYKFDILGFLWMEVGKTA
jgi:hypothetical protein